VDQSLSRPVKRGEIERLTCGVFVNPQKGRYVGKVLPETAKVAQAIAKAHGETIQVMVGACLAIWAYEPNANAAASYNAPIVEKSREQVYSNFRDLFEQIRDA
jgi:Family of unknown function (DUF6088)